MGLGINIKKDLENSAKKITSHIHASLKNPLATSKIKKIIKKDPVLRKLVNNSDVLQDVPEELVLL